MHFLAYSSIQGIKDSLKDLSRYLVFPMPKLSDCINFFITKLFLFFMANTCFIMKGKIKFVIGCKDFGYLISLEQ